MKVAVPVVVKVLKTVASESDDEDTELQNLFDSAITIANSIHEICGKLVCSSIFLHILDCRCF